MIFRTAFTPTVSPAVIEPQSRLFLIGSCFSDSIGNALKNSGLRTTINPFGATYNPLSICAVLRSILSQKNIENGQITQSEGLFRSFMHHSFINAPTADELISRAAEINEKASEELAACDHLFITLGTSWVYEHINSAMVVNNCHKRPAPEFRRYPLSVQEIFTAFDSLFSEFPKLLKKNIIFTLSPIRHLNDGFAGNSASKATLRVAIGGIIEKYPQIGYFEAFEIMNDDLRDYRFYAQDMVHPSEEAVQYIFSLFKETFFSETTNDFAKRYTKLKQALSHRPISPGSPVHSDFLRKTEAEAAKFRAEFPFAEL